MISAAVPVKKQPTKSFISSGFIFLSITFIPLPLAILITSLLVIPSRKESGVGVCNSLFLFLKKIFAPVASAILPSWSSIKESVYPCLSASCLESVHIIYKPAAFVSQGTELGLGLLQDEIFSVIPLDFDFGSK